jgi:hypothetical protein
MAECAVPGFEPVFEAPPGANSLRVSAGIRAATFTLFYDEQFAGTAFAVGPRLVMSAGHHFKTSQNDPGLLRLHAEGHRGKKEGGTVGVAYVQKDRFRDLLIMWPEEDVPFVPLRGWLPGVGSRVLTLYASPRPPHKKLVESPGTVSTVGDRLCRSHGTVTTQGASGAPVVDSFGEYVIGLHISVSNSAADGSWVSEFAPSAAVVDMLCDAGVDPAVPYRVEDEEPAVAKAAKPAETPLGKCKGDKKTASATKSATVMSSKMAASASAKKVGTLSRKAATSKKGDSTASKKLIAEEKKSATKKTPAPRPKAGKAQGKVPAAPGKKKK